MSDDLKEIMDKSEFLPPDENDFESTQEVEKKPSSRKQYPLPDFLDSLVTLPGIDAEILKRLDMSTAWILVKSDHGTTKMPVAHLSPDAYVILTDNIGHHGHAKFTFLQSENSRHPIYAAAMFPTPDAEQYSDDDQTNDQLTDMFVKQNQRFSIIEKALEQMIGDPLKPLEHAFNMMDRMGEFMEKAQSRMIQGAGGGGFDIKKMVDTIATVTDVVKGAVGGVPPGDPNGPMKGDVPDGE